MTGEPNPMATHDRGSAGGGARGTATLILLGLAGGVVLLDQLSKWWILTVVMQPPRIIPLAPFLNLILTFNRGISFGLLRGEESWGPWLLSAVAIGIVVWLVRWQYRSMNRMTAMGVGLIAGGALGNVIDRLSRHAVTDFIDFHWAGIHFWAFNLADSAITIGVGLLLAEALFGERESPNT